MMDGGHERAVTRLPSDPSAVPAARRFASQAVASSGGHGELLDRTALLVTELTTNAVVHADSPVRLSVMPGPERVRVEVRDDVPCPITEPSPPDPESERGRGLWLVSTLSSSWGVNGNDKGKTIWFEVGTAFSVG